MVKQKTAKKILDKVKKLKLCEVRGEQYLDTHNLGIEVWYETFLKMGCEEPIFMEAIESPDRRVAIQTAHNMGQKRDSKKIVKSFYEKSTDLIQFPSGHPTKMGPVGLVIPSRDGFEYIGFEFDPQTHKFKNDEYDLVNKLNDKYYSLTEK